MIDDKYLKNNYIYFADVGAMGGVQPKWKDITNCYFSVLFEPNKSSYEELIVNKKENEIIINSGLLNKKGKTVLNICKSKGASSIFEPNYKFLKLFHDVERFEIQSNENINTDTLDNQLIKNNIKELDFMKVDVQGSELKVLNGSTNTLKGIIGLEIECEISEIYNNQPLFSDILQFLNSKEFHLFDLKRYYWKRKNAILKNNKKGQLVFVDALFFKQPEILIREFHNDHLKLLKAYYLYLFYGYSDLAKIILNYLSEKNLINDIILKDLSNNISNIDTVGFVVPYFPGKKILKRLFNKLSLLFSDHDIYNKNLEWKKNHYLGNDHDLGN
tara:strand:- start:978 stop:1967 length:990 start_codon:yes stop_codon:yes gene_type:complete